MHDIEVANRMVYQDLQDKLTEKLSAGKIGKFISNFADFDSTFFQVVCEDRQNIIVSLQLSYWEILKNEANIVDYLDNIYSDCTGVSRLPEARVESDMTYNISLSINIEQLASASEEDQQKTITEVSKLRRNCFAAAFSPHFEAHKARNQTTEPMVIPFRDQETMFIKAKADHVVVIFSTTFKDKTDQVLAKEFLSAFADAKVSRGLNPPNCILSKDPPREIKEHEQALIGDHVYYITFVLQNAHIEQTNKADNTIDLIHTFRTYLHYHIKCSKAYIHARMRKKTSEFEQILNRAKPEKQTKVLKKYG